MIRRSARISVTAAVLVVGTAGSLAAASGVASASAPVVTCTTASGIFPGGALSGCSDKKVTGGKGTVKANNTTHLGTITWNGTGKTMFTYTDVFLAYPNACSPGGVGMNPISEYRQTVTVTGGTGAAGKAIKRGQQATDYFCSTFSRLTLAPGSTYRI